MTTKTMAEVLAAHLLDCVMYIGTGQEYLCICGNRASDHGAHQVEMLVGAGFGLITPCPGLHLVPAPEDESGW